MKRRLRRLAGASIILIVVSELIVRAAVGVPPLHPHPQVPLTYHHTRGFRLPADFTGFSLNAPVRLNEQGFRTESAQEVSNIPHRIVALGDSMLFGQGIEREQTFCELTSSSNAYIVNLGVPGYDLVQAITVLKEVGRFYYPSEAQLHVVPNDLLPNREPETFKKLKGDPRPDPHPFLRHSALVMLLGQQWRSRQDPHHPFKRVLRDEDPKGVVPEWNKARQAVLGPIRYFKDICHDLKIRPVVVIHPVPWQSISAARWQHMLKDWCNRLQIKSIDLLGPLDNSCWIPFDGHYSVEGHKKVARQLRDYLYGENK